MIGRSSPLIHDLIELQAARTPRAIAVVFEGSHLTYAELSARTNRLALHLRKLGVGPDVLVGVCLERSLDLVVALLGVLRAGGAYVPLDPSYPEERLSFMLEDSQASLLITSGGLLAASRPETRVVSLDAVSTSTLDTTRDVRPELHADHLAYVIYTSGSTGRPKGAMNTHGAILNRLLWMQEAFRLDASDAVLQKTPFSFDVSVWELFWPLMFGARLVVAPPTAHRDSAHLAKLIRSEQITTAHFVPSMLQAFLDEPACRSCTSLRRVICSGEALLYQLTQRFFERLGSELHNLYGPTEAAVDVTWWSCKRGDPRKFVPIGSPISNTYAHILDGDLRPVPAGLQGELYLEGVQLARGYVHRPDLTAERFLPSANPHTPGARMYRTGDLARLHDDGALEFLGRADNQIKLHGFRIELAEIEVALADCTGVREAVVRAYEASSGTRLVGYVVPKRDASLSKDDLRKALARTLPEYMVPSEIVVLDQLPLTPSGKIDRQALPHPDVAPRTSYVAPATGVEDLVAEVFCDALKVDRVGTSDDFFDLGGDSISALRMLASLHQRFAVEIPLHELFQMKEASVASLAAKIAVLRSNVGDGPAAPRLQRTTHDGPVELSPNQLQVWRWQERHPGNSSRRLIRGVRLSGPLDTNVLSSAVDEAFRRHPVLRTRFERSRSGDVPMQVVTPKHNGVIEVIDLSDTCPEQRSKRVGELAVAEWQKPVDLGSPSLTRLLLVRFAGDDHTLILVTHHIVIDLPHAFKLFADILGSYEALSEGRSLTHPTLEIDYADYSIWRNEHIRHADLSSQRSHWDRALRGLRPLALPFDKPLPTERTAGMYARPVDIDDAVFGVAAALAHAESVTRFSVMSAAFAVFLSKTCGQEDVGFLALSALDQARAPDLANVLGCFLDFLPIRLKVSDAMTFRQLVRTAGGVVKEAAANMDLPSSVVVGDPAVFDAPVARALLNTFEGMPAIQQRVGDLKVETTVRLSAPRVTELAWSLFPQSGRTVVALSSDVFDEPNAALFGRQAASLLTDLLAAPDEPIGSIKVACR